jgi:uncharacterized protein (DUF983 family)
MVVDLTLMRRDMELVSPSHWAPIQLWKPMLLVTCLSKSTEVN